MLSARRHPGLKRHPTPGKAENKREEFGGGVPLRSVARREFFRTAESAVRFSRGRSEFVALRNSQNDDRREGRHPVRNGQPSTSNSASKKDLAALPGIGPHEAQSIIDARPFGSKEDLLKKNLIPQETHDRMQRSVTSNDPKKQALPEGPQA
jgi:hypothetical protein